MKDLNPLSVEEAADWQARLGAPDCTEFERARFERWRREHRHHDAAHSAIEGFDLDVLVLAQTDLRMAALIEEASQPVAMPAPVRPARVRRGWTIPASLAAGILLTLTGFLAYQHWGPLSGEPVMFSTAAREQGNVTLLDGSTVRLDVATSLDVRITARQRDITLRRGRALFVVKSDAERPFSVRAGSSRIVALGTAFQVRYEGERIVINLTEGAVAVSVRHGSVVRQDRLVPGDQLTYSADASYWVKEKVDTDAATSWTRGRLVFRGSALADVVAEVNRYASRPLVLGNRSLASLEVSGTFVLGDSAITAAGLAALLPVRIEDTGKGEIVLRPAGGR